MLANNMQLVRLLWILAVKMPHQFMCQKSRFRTGNAWM